MCAGPVDLFARIATVKGVIIFHCQGLKLVKNFLFWYRSENSIAAHAAAEGTDFVRQVVKIYYFGQLFVGEGFPYEMSEFYFFSFEELEISAEQDSVSAFRYIS